MRKTPKCVIIKTSKIRAAFCDNRATGLATAIQKRTLWGAFLAWV